MYAHLGKSVRHWARSVTTFCLLLSLTTVANDVTSSAQVTEVLQAQANRTDIVIISDIHPSAYAEGNSPVLDISAQLFDFYSFYLSDYQLHSRFINAPRALSEMQQRTNYCWPKAVKTAERSALGYFSSQPQVIFPPLRLYMLANHPRAAQVQGLIDNSADGHVALETLVQLGPELVLGAMRGRSYTPAVDSVIQALEPNGQIWVRTVPDRATGLFDMLLNGRIDMSLHNSVEMRHFMDLRQLEPELLVVPLREASEPLLGYVMCSRSDVTRRFLADLDHAISASVKQRGYFDLHMSWVPEAEQAYYQQIYNQQFGTEFELSDKPQGAD